MYAQTTKEGYTIVQVKPGNWTVSHPEKPGVIHVFGNGHIYYPHDGEYGDTISYRGCEYDELIVMNGPWGGPVPDWMRVFGDAYTTNTFFSGVIAKEVMDDNGEVGFKMFTFIA